MKALHIITLVTFSLAAHYSFANITPCGYSDDIQSANQTANNTFLRFVKSNNLSGSVDPQDPTNYLPPAGAFGDGIHDDTTALQQALNTGNKSVLLLPNKIYKISKKLKLTSGAHIKSDGTATILMSSSGFNNPTTAVQTGITTVSIYNSEKDQNLQDKNNNAVGLEIKGKNITIENVFIVKEYEDNKYTIAIHITSDDAPTEADFALTKTQHIAINRVSIRGFSLAPGIISINSVDDVTISNSLIHSSCSTTGPVPANLNAYQITGITVDEGRRQVANTIPKDSTNIKIMNNVIMDLMTKNTERSIDNKYPDGRKDQSDGINFQGGNGNNVGTIISGNYINGVAEGVDLFGGNINVTGNSINAREQAIKLIHGANNININNNYIGGKYNVAGIGIWDIDDSEQSCNANPSCSPKTPQVKNITIDNNYIDMRYSLVAGLYVKYTNDTVSPKPITVNNNIFAANLCSISGFTCNSFQCTTANNEKLHEGLYPCP